MLKVHFKKEFKEVEIHNNCATIVTLNGNMDLFGSFYGLIPTSVVNWVMNHPSVKVHPSYTRENALCIEVSGKSLCSKSDTFNSIVGERIAESRAKIRLYRFMHTFCRKLITEYHELVFGNAEVRILQSHDSTPEDCIMDTCHKYKVLYDRETRHLNKLICQS